MKVDVKELLESAGLGHERIYDGKRLVRPYVQHGELNRSHSVVFERHDGLYRVELKAGLSGNDLPAKELRLHPVSFQARTYVELEAEDKDDEEDKDGARGKSGGGGGKKPVRDLADSDLTTMSAFSKMAEGAVSTLAEVTKMVIMGKEIAKESYAQAMENFKEQLSQTKIMVMDLMKGVTGAIHKATPGGGLSPRGDETVKYKYDAERNSVMFGGLTPT